MARLFGILQKKRGDRRSGSPLSGVLGEISLYALVLLLGLISLGYLLFLPDKTPDFWLMLLIVGSLLLIGGGGMMDIGCYPISLSRFIFDRMPQRVFAIAEFDSRFQTDILASVTLDFGNGTSTFTSSTQLAPYQRVNIFGDTGRIEIEIPFNAPPDQPCRLWHQDENAEIEEIHFEVCDQYGIQGDLFSRAILDDTGVPTPIEDAVQNMLVIEAVFRSAESGSWESISAG